MKLKDYVRKNEGIVKSVKASEGRYSMGESQKGRLAVTPNRVVFVQEKMAADISLNGVNSIEYHAPSYPTRYLYWSVGCLCLAALLWVFSVAAGESAGAAPLLAVIAFLSSLGIAAVGLILRKSVLVLNTPNRTYEFVSKDETLADIAHALRGHENR